MAYHPYISVLCIHSGARRYSYRFPFSSEHERAWNWLTAGPEQRLNLMHAVAVHGAADFVGIRNQLGERQHSVRSWLESALQKFGVHPHSTQRFFKGIKRGMWVGAHMPFTSSMPPPLSPALQTHFGDQPTADAYLGRGWREPEDTGRWTSGGTAELFFTIPSAAGSGPFALEICGFPLRDGDAVTFQIDGEAPITKEVFRANEISTIDLPKLEAYRLTLSVDAPTSPFKLGESNDRRILGYRLSWLRLIPRLEAD